MWVAHHFTFKSIFLFHEFDTMLLTVLPIKMVFLFNILLAGGQLKSSTIVVLLSNQKFSHIIQYTIRLLQTLANKAEFKHSKKNRFQNGNPCNLHLVIGTYPNHIIS